MKKTRLMKFRVVRDVNLSGGPKVGEIWVTCTKYDYGLRSDHERITGESHINLSRNGNYPFFTVPESTVEAVA